MIRFIAPSGNSAAVTIETNAGNAAIDMNWDRVPTEEDISAAEQFIKETLNPAEVHSIYEPDAEKRKQTAKRHLGAPLN